MTLIFDRPEADSTRSTMRYEGLWKVLSEAGVDVPIADVKNAYDESASKLNESWKSGVELSTNDQIKIILDGVSSSAVALIHNSKVMDEMRKAYVAPLLVLPPSLNKDAPPTLKELRHKTNKIGLVSNTGRVPGAALRQLLEKYDVLRYFDATIFSDEVGWRKPDYRIYHEAAKKLDAPITRGIHIGDNPETDVWGAKEAGMRAVLFLYDLPEGFSKIPNSTTTLSRTRQFPDLEIKPDGRISSLKEAVKLIDSLR